MRKLFIALIGITSVVQAQNADYFAELSAPTEYGDARYNAMSGATIAMSGSFTALALNPAGASLYTQDAANLDMGIFNARDYNVTEGFIPMRNTRMLNLSNFGYLGKDPESGIKFFFTYNTDQIFRERIAYSGTDLSIQLPWMDNSIGTAPDYLGNIGLYEDLLYQSYATDWDLTSGEYTSTADLTKADFEHSLFRRGMRNRWTFGGGYELDPTLHVGASFSLVHSFETVDMVHSETYATTTDLTSFSLTEWWNNNAIGMAANVGIIFRPVQAFRLGASLELPQIYSFQQDWDVEMNVNRPTISNNVSQQAYGYDYQWSMWTAPKLNLGSTLLFGRSGLLSARYTLVPHQMAGTWNSDLDFLNDNMDSLYTTQHHYALGGEWRIGPLSLRGGGSLSPSYNNQSSAGTISKSLGIAFSERKSSFQISWRQSLNYSNYYAFNGAYSNPIQIERNKAMVIAGMTWKL